MRLGYHSITWGGVIGAPVGVTSVKDLYYRSNGSLADAVADIAAVGYDGVEIFDGNLMDYAGRPGELRSLVGDSGLELIGVYTGANFVYDEIRRDEMHKVRSVVELAEAVGAATLVVGGGARRSGATPDTDYARLAAALDEVTDIAEEHGMQACYHPHLTTIVETPGELARLMPHTRIGFCPDTGHLAAGGGDPAALIRQYPDRIRHVHLKDAVLEPLSFTPLGEGELDFADVMAALGEIGYDGWLTVELDEYAGHPREAAEKSKAYLDRVITALAHAV